MAWDWLSSLGVLFKGSSSKHVEVVIQGFKDLLTESKERERELKTQLDENRKMMQKLVEMEEQCLQEHVESRQEIRDLKEQIIFLRNKK